MKALGFKSYLVGGAVRDLYLEKSPKDYDVGTDARPSRLKKIFRNCRIIGRRFRIAHVYFPSGRIVEVATFRQSSSKIVRGESGIILRDNDYGTPGQDALRRDLTINGLFYDIATFSVIDYVGGMRDLRDGIIRTISEPNMSFREDPVRMIRALRHAARTGFSIEEKTLEAIYANSGEIVQANSSRLLEEFFRDLRGGFSLRFFQMFAETGLLEYVLPELSAQLGAYGPEEHPLWKRLEALDRQSSEENPSSNAVLLSVLLHTLLFRDAKYWNAARNNPPDVWSYISEGFRSIPGTIRISRRDTERVAQILIAYRKLEQCLERGKLTPSLGQKNYVYDALEFFRIDLEARGLPTECVDDWKKSFQERKARGSSEKRQERGGPEKAPRPDDSPGKPRRRRRRRRSRRSKK